MKVTHALLFLAVVASASAFADTPTVECTHAEGGTVTGPSPQEAKAAADMTFGSTSAPAPKVQKAEASTTGH
jgi:predicted alpha/beta hydrolase